MVLLLLQQVSRLLCDLALATQKFSRRHVVEYVAAATDGQGRLYAKQSCAQYLPKPVRAFIYAQTHQEVDMAGAHYELIRRFVNSSSLPHIEVLRTALAAIWGEDCCIGSENIIKMFPVRGLLVRLPPCDSYNNIAYKWQESSARLPLILMRRKLYVRMLCSVTGRI